VCQLSFYNNKTFVRLCIPHPPGFANTSLKKIIIKKKKGKKREGGDGGGGRGERALPN